MKKHVFEAFSSLKNEDIGRNLISFQSLGLDIQVLPDMKTYYVGQMSIDM